MSQEEQKPTEQETLKEKRSREGKLYVREWHPTEWREATEEEKRELHLEELPFDTYRFMRRFRRFWRKVNEAFDELSEV